MSLTNNEQFSIYDARLNVLKVNSILSCKKDRLKYVLLFVINAQFCNNCGDVPACYDAMQNETNMLQTNTS